MGGRLRMGFGADLLPGVLAIVKARRCGAGFRRAVFFRVGELEAAEQDAPLHAGIAGPSLDTIAPAFDFVWATPAAHETLLIRPARSVHAFMPDFHARPQGECPGAEGKRLQGFIDAGHGVIDGVDDAGVQRGHRQAEGLQAGQRGDGDERRDQAILNGRPAGFVQDQIA